MHRANDTGHRIVSPIMPRPHYRSATRWQLLELPSDVLGTIITHAVLHGSLDGMRQRAVCALNIRASCSMLLAMLDEELSSQGRSVWASLSSQLLAAHPHVRTVEGNSACWFFRLFHAARLAFLRAPPPSPGQLHIPGFGQIPCNHWALVTPDGLGFQCRRLNDEESPPAGEVDPDDEDSRTELAVDEALCPLTLRLSLPSATGAYGDSYDHYIYLRRQEAPGSTDVHACYWLAVDAGEYQLRLGGGVLAAITPCGPHTAHARASRPPCRPLQQPSLPWLRPPLCRGTPVPPHHNHSTPSIPLYPAPAHHVVLGVRASEVSTCTV